MTLACCSAAFSAGGRPSMRACRTPASVDGTRTSRSLSAETRHGSLLDDDHAVVDQHADQLLDEVRVALGAAREQVAQRRRHGLELAEQRLDELARAALGERRQVDAQVIAAAAAPERPALEERRRASGRGSNSGTSPHACAR